MFKKISLASMVVMLLLFAVSASFAAGQFKPEYKMSTNVSEITPPGKAVAYFAEQVKKRTDGKVNIKIYWNGQLFAGKASNEFMLMKNGVGDFSISTFMNWAPQFPAGNLFLLPWFVSSEPNKYKALDAIENGKAGAELKQRLSKMGVEVIGWGEQGARADITQGLPRVEELFEARKPKGLAIITEIDGTVKIAEEKNKKEVIVKGDKEAKTYVIPFGSKLKVREGDTVEAGDPLTEGSINPNEILAIKGPDGVFRYLVQEVQRVYRNQGVDINDKHIEVIARQMLKKVRVEDNGDTTMFAGSLVDMHDFEDENNRVIAEGKTPAKGKRVLLGITKASLATESFLSAASFQETTRVLTEAAIKGKVDELIGLKENVIIGKLIPAGTGMAQYQATKIKTELDADFDDGEESFENGEELGVEDNAEVSSSQLIRSHSSLPRFSTCGSSRDHVFRFIGIKNAIKIVKAVCMTKPTIANALISWIRDIFVRANINHAPFTYSSYK